MVKLSDNVHPSPKGDNQKWNSGRLCFLIFVVALYTALYVAAPQKTIAAIQMAGGIGFKLIMPLCIVVFMMMVFNVWLTPGHITRAIEKCSGYKAGLYAMGAGVISMGPVYAWYPLLKNLRDKGLGNGLIAIFMGGRAIKPAYMPLLASVFGWQYVALLTLFTIAGTLAAGFLVGLVVKR